MNTKASDQIQKFIASYVNSKEGQIKNEIDEVFTVTYPNSNLSQEYTYQPSVSREKNVDLLTLGSSAFQQILNECLKKGTLCQIQIKLPNNNENFVKQFFKDSNFTCETCLRVDNNQETNNICIKPYPCYHKINNSKIDAVTFAKTESLRYFLFFFSVNFQNKLRTKNEETIRLLIDEKNNNIINKDFNEELLLENNTLEIKELKSKIRCEGFENIKAKAEQKLSDIIEAKVELYDLPIIKEKKTKLKLFKNRLRRERRERIISKTCTFDFNEWQNNYEELIKKEKEAYITTVSAKLTNLLIINTSKVKFEIELKNKAIIPGSFILGIQHSCEIICPLCHKTFTEGYATQDNLYVCGECVRQSIDTGKIYSKKTALSVDDNLKEYFEHEKGFICSACGKKHSHLLEFKCSYDNSSVCIYHYDTCDVCGKVFSILNLTYTNEFQKKLCPQHAKLKG